MSESTPKGSGRFSSLHDACTTGPGWVAGIRSRILAFCWMDRPSWLSAGAFELLEAAVFSAVAQHWALRQRRR